MNFQSIKSIFKKKLISELKDSERNEILCHYNIRPERIRVIQQKPKWAVYDIDGKAILKITHSSDKSYETIRAISSWQDAMNKHAKEVIPVIPSRSGELTVKFDKLDGYFTSVLYHRAIGEMFGKGDWHEDVIVKVGALTGKLHIVSQIIPDSKVFEHIPIWHEIVINQLLQHLPAEDHLLIERFFHLLYEIKKVPYSSKNYGIIHSDIFLGNLIHNNGELMIYDFDDTCISWFAGDAVNVLYFSMLDSRMGIENARHHIRQFMSSFWKGYHEHNSIDEEISKFLPSFLALRAIYIYSYYCKLGYEKSTFPATVDFFNCVRDLALNDWENMDYHTFI